MTTTVFGSGAWGTAIAMLLSSKGYDVTLWSAFESEAKSIKEKGVNPYLPGIKVPENIKITADMSATDSKDMAVIAVPSFAVRTTAKRMREVVPKGVPIVCVSKGIEEGSLKCFSEVIEEELGKDNPVVILSGPSHAEEVGRGIPTACVAASRDLRAAEFVQDVFISKHFRVYTTDDVVGVELGAALKNIIAFCAGVCDGLGYGDNTIAMLMTRGLAEMAELGVAMGGNEETFAGLAGMGDLIVTCTSKHSRNRRAGYLVGQGLSMDDAMKQVGSVVESYYATKAAVILAEKTGVDMPITQEAYSVMYEGKNIEKAVDYLLLRSKKTENSSNLAAEGWIC